MAYQYGDLGDGSGTVVPLTEGNLPPLLVLWLLFVVNPNILNGATADDYQNIGDKLNLTPSCVKAAFDYVKGKPPVETATQQAALVFQHFVQGPPEYGGGGNSCGVLDTIMTLASKGASATWGA